MARRFLLAAACIGTLVTLSTPSFAQWHVDGVLLSADGALLGIIPDGSGGAIIAWTEDLGGLYIQKVNAAGVPVWSSGGVSLLPPACQIVGEVALAPDGAGGVVLAWNQNCSGAMQEDDIFAQHVLTSGVVDPVWTAANGNPYGTPVCTATSQQISPRVAPDGAGGLFVGWWDGRDYGTPSGDFIHQWDIYAHHVQSTGIVNPAWPVNGTAVATQYNDQRWPLLVADGAGGAIIAWWSAHLVNTGGDFAVFAHHLLSSGTLDAAWPNGGHLCSVGDASAPDALCPDGSGGGLVVWSDSRNGSDYRAFLVRLASAGVAAGWPATGVGLSSTSGSQDYADMIPDGSGGAIVVLQDWRSGSPEIYVQHVLPSGLMDATWPVNGLHVSLGSAYPSQTALATDGAGGAIVVWEEGGSSPIGIVAHHVMASGSLDPAWPANGNPIGNGFDPLVVSDGAGGGIIAWHGSVRVQRVYGEGGVADVSLGQPDAPALAALRPNPSLGATEIVFQLPASASVSASIHDLAGHRIRSLQTGRHLSPGTHRIFWDGDDESGARVPAGMYFVRITAGRTSTTGKLAIVR